MKIVCFDISELTKEQFFFLYNGSTDERKEKADKYKIEEDKKRCIVAGKLLEYALKNWLFEQDINYEKSAKNASSFNTDNVDIFSIDNTSFNAYNLKKTALSSLEIQKGKNGKPFLKNIKNFHFNISHSGKWVVIGYGSDELGIDIEKINENEKQTQKKLAERYFAKNEIEYIFQNEYELSKRFTEIWTKKEAYLKFSGKGISCNLNYVDTTKITDILGIQFEKDYYISLYSNSSQKKYSEKVFENIEIISFNVLCK